MTNALKCDSWYLWLTSSSSSKAIASNLPKLLLLNTSVAICSHTSHEQ
jgi:hypothetical protein